MSQQEVNRTVTIAPQGLGYGKGSISTQDRINDSSDLLTAETVSEVGEMIHAIDGMRRVLKDDSDGCSDGRVTKRILLDGEEHAPIGLRMKVFGGGLTMGVSGLIGTGKVSNETLRDTFSESQKLFQTAGRNYGAHSADHARGENCGCGAIDLAPKIIKTALEYRSDITRTIMVLAGSKDGNGILQDRIDGVFDNYAEFNGYQDDEINAYRGVDVMGDIADNGKIIAELSGDHREVRVVMNIDIEDHTFSQASIREATHDQAQVFAIDVPRMRSIAESLFESEDDQADALISMFVFTLAAAAELTKGDLPVDLKYREESEINFLSELYATV